MVGLGWPTVWACPYAVASEPNSCLPEDLGTMTKSAADAVPNAAISKLRGSVGLSQSDIADRLNTLAIKHGQQGFGVTANTVSRWERGIVKPSHLYRRMLAELFGTTVDELGIAQ